MRSAFAQEQDLLYLAFWKKILYFCREVIDVKTTVTSRGQTVVPAKIREGHKIRPRMKLDWIDDGETIRVVPMPADSIRAAKGSSKGFRRRLLRERALERKRD